MLKAITSRITFISYIIIIYLSVVSFFFRYLLYEPLSVGEGL